MAKPFFYQWPARIEPDGGGFMVSFRDVPEALTGADTSAEILSEAADALTVALAGYVEAGKIPPAPSRRVAGEVLIAVPPVAAAKLALGEALRSHDMKAADLASMLRRDHKIVRRLLSLDHNSKIEAVEEALALLGGHLVVGYEEAA